MNFRKFHNPNICLPIIRRRIGEELLNLLGWYLEVSATRGRSLTWNKSFPNREAYYGAVYRLRKAGLITYRRRKNNEIVLGLTPKGESKLPDVLHPKSFWGKKWNGIWYMMVYDIPEKDRKYRDTLRKFLYRMRMGCLQRSVYVTCRDIRPEYNDMVETSGIQQFAYLLEAQTVLGQSAMEIVESAWDFNKLGETQHWYDEIYSDNLQRVLSSKLAKEALENLAREEMSAYLVAMADDPLLPESLLPKDYIGRAVYSLHQKLTFEISKRL
ncbi:MAG: hypothetical protein J7L73_07380 [Anaerolineales bacterium]|nr:hypothetical protein [Anaerolineales bacterium]